MVSYVKLCDRSGKVYRRAMRMGSGGGAGGGTRKVSWNTGEGDQVAVAGARGGGTEDSAAV